MSEHAPVAERQPVTQEAATAPDAEPPRPPLTRRLRRDAAFFLIAITVIVLDQVTKAIVRRNLEIGEAWPEPDMLFNIVYVTNSGAAFGMLQGQTLFLVVTSLVGVAAIVLYYIFPPLEHGLLRAALGLQLGGAAGNLIDRVRLGEVTDFINFSFWPAFNVADASISIGVVTILWFFITMESERLRDPPNADAARD
ncbi:MAG: signal peptidase II [Dehalococcoidia bacterium]